MLADWVELETSRARDTGHLRRDSRELWIMGLGRIVKDDLLVYYGSVNAS